MRNKHGTRLKTRSDSRINAASTNINIASRIVCVFTDAIFCALRLARKMPAIASTAIRSWHANHMSARSSCEQGSTIQCHPKALNSWPAQLPRSPDIMPRAGRASKVIELLPTTMCRDGSQTHSVRVIACKKKKDKIDLQGNCTLYEPPARRTQRLRETPTSLLPSCVSASTLATSSHLSCASSWLRLFHASTCAALLCRRRECRRASACARRALSEAL